MRGWLRTLVTILASVFGAGTLSPLISANWQESAKSTGNDQYIVKYASQTMDSLASITQSGLFIFAAGFFIGGTVFLWIDYFLRRRPQLSHSHTTLAPGNQAVDLAHTLHLAGGTGVHVGIDKKQKSIQIGFNLKNSAPVALRYTVQDANSAVEGHTVMNPNFSNRGGVVAKDGVTTFLCAPIPFVMGTKVVKAVASIVYQYGLAGASETPVREANYRVEVTINLKASAYVILEENDGPI